MNYTHFTAKEIQTQRRQVTYWRPHCPKGTQTHIFWLFFHSIPALIIEFYTLFVVLSPGKCLRFSKKTILGKCKWMAILSTGWQRALSVPLWRLLRFLTLPEMYILKDVTVWLHSLLEDKNTMSWQKNDCLGFYYFLDILALHCVNVKGNYYLSFGCGAEQFSLAFSVMGRVMQCCHFGEGLVFRDQQLSGL